MPPKARRVLVTGASGFLGRRIVALLVARGFVVRALVLDALKAKHIQLPGVELVVGDVAVVESLQPAFKDVDYVIHAAADTSGSEEGGARVTIGGTRNVLELCAENRVKKLVYISSCSVYGVAGFLDGQVVDETSPLESHPQRRGAYSWAKLEAEKLVTEAMARQRIAAVCLRPGTIYGCGGGVYSPMLGFSIGRRVFAVIGNGSFVLPLVYVDNLTEAILVAMTQEQSTGQVYTVVDPQRVNKKRYMTELVCKLYPRAWVCYVPYGLLKGLVALQEKVFGLLHRKPILTLYRLVSSQKSILYDSSKIMQQLDWRSGVSFEEAARRIVAFEHGR